MRRLTDEERQSLKWIAGQRDLVWCGVYDHGGDAVVAKLVGLGLVDGVRKPMRFSKAAFSGGYRITEAGRLALREQDDG